MLADYEDDTPDSTVLDGPLGGLRPGVGLPLTPRVQGAWGWWSLGQPAAVRPAVALDRDAARVPALSPATGTRRRVVVFSEARLSFDGRKTALQSFAVGRPIPVFDWEELTLLVRLHEIGSWAATSSLLVSVESVQSPPEDPSVLFVGAELCAVRITATDVAPGLWLEVNRDVVGSHVRVLVSFDQGADEAVAPQTAKISVELLGGTP